MVSHGSCGVTNGDGSIIKTKKQLKEIIANDGVVIVRVLSFGNEHQVSLSNDSVYNTDKQESDGSTNNAVYYVCGPVAEVDRKWYAEVVVNNGKVTVK